MQEGYAGSPQFVVNDIPGLYLAIMDAEKGKFLLNSFECQTCEKVRRVRFLSLLNIQFLFFLLFAS